MVVDFQSKRIHLWKEVDIRRLISNARVRRDVERDFNRRVEFDALIQFCKAELKARELGYIQ